MKGRLIEKRKRLRVPAITPNLLPDQTVLLWVNDPYFDEKSYSWILHCHFLTKKQEIVTTKMQWESFWLYRLDTTFQGGHPDKKMGFGNVYTIEVPVDGEIVNCNRMEP